MPSFAPEPVTVIVWPIAKAASVKAGEVDEIRPPAASEVKLTSPVKSDASRSPPIVTLSPMVVGWVLVITWTTVPSWTLLRLPILIQFTSPRITTHIQTLLSSPISTSPIT